MKEQDLPKTHGIHTPKGEPLKKRLLTIQEAAFILGRSVPAVRELQWAGSLPFVKVGRRIHFDVADLDKWIEEHKARYTY